MRPYNSFGRVWTKLSALLKEKVSHLCTSFMRDYYYCYWPDHTGGWVRGSVRLYVCTRNFSSRWASPLLVRRARKSAERKRNKNMSANNAVSFQIEQNSIFPCGHTTCLPMGKSSEQVVIERAKWGRISGHIHRLTWIKSVHCSTCNLSLGFSIQLDTEDAIKRSIFSLKIYTTFFSQPATTPPDSSNPIP